MPPTIEINLDPLKRGSLSLLRDLLLIARSLHRANLYSLGLGGAGIALAIAPYMLPVNAAAKLGMTAGSIPLTLISASGLGKQATEEERREAEENYRHSLKLEALKDGEAIKVEADLIRLQEREYADLPVHLRPDRYELKEWNTPKKDMAEAFLERALKGIDEALDEEDEEQPGATSGETTPAKNSAPSIGGFDTIDLAEEAAKNDKSLLISGISGAGKTTLLRHIIHAIHRVNEGNETILGIDFKGSTGHFCGLERSSNWITSPAPGHNYKQAIARIADVVDELGTRESDLPLYLICDEINNGLEQAKAQPSKQGERKAEEVLKSSLKFIATQGRERLIRGVMTAHGNLMGMLGIDGDTAQSLVCAVLGRKVDKGDGFALIGKVLMNQVLFSKQERAVLAPKFDAIRKIAERTKQAIALTNIRGDWEFILLPSWYENDPGMVKDWGVQNQSVTQIIAGETPTDSKPQTEIHKPLPNAETPASSRAIEPPPPKANDFIQWARENPELTQNSWLDVKIACAAWGELPLMDFAKFLGALVKAGLGEFEPSSRLEKFRIFDSQADSEILTKLQNYLQRKRAIALRSLQKNWATNYKISAEELTELLNTLVDRAVCRVADGIVEICDETEEND